MPEVRAGLGPSREGKWIGNRDLSRPHWNHYFKILLRNTRWVRWNYAQEGGKEKTYPLHVNPEVGILKIKEFNDTFEFKFDIAKIKGYDCDGKKFVPVVVDVVDGWSWQICSPDFYVHGGWRFCGSHEACLEDAWKYITNTEFDRKIIPDGFLEAKDGEMVSIPMDEKWNKLAKEQFQRIDNWSKGKGYTLGARS